MSKFHDLRVAEIRPETKDCVSIVLEVPAEKAKDFAFIQGQYLTFKQVIGGEEVRRSYSICSSPLDAELRVAVKRIEGGKMSGFLNTELKVGDSLTTMVPFGNFYTTLNTFNRNAYYFFAAGSGITPILSHIKTILAKEPQAKLVLFYGNRSEEEIIFKGVLETLEKQYAERFKLVYCLSKPRLEQDALHLGRIDRNKTEQLLKHYTLPGLNGIYFACGPGEMMLNVKEVLAQRKVDANKVHIEFFTTPLEGKVEGGAGAVGGSSGAVGGSSGAVGGSSGAVGGSSGAVGGGSAQGPIASVVTFVCDGDEKTVNVPANKKLLEAALEANIDASYACKGGSCCTCRAKITEGKADMVVNYALMDDEVTEGFVLTCQAFATTPTLRVDYDRGK